MQTASRRGPVAVAAFVIVLLVAACGGSAALPATGGAGFDKNPLPADPSAAPAASAASGEGTGSNGAAVDDAKIVRTGTLELQVATLDDALAKARDAIRSMGGYVSASQQRNDGDNSVASITYRIPTARWDDALAALRGLAKKVVDEQTNAVEVTGQLIDLGARIDNLRASEKALQAIAAQATKISDVLDVQAQLTNVRGQIEELTAQQAHLQDQTALGTLTVTYGLQVVAVTEAAKHWDPASEVDRASASLVDLLQALATAGIWFAIVWLPILVAFAVVALVARLVVRRLGIGRITARPSPPAAPPAQPPAAAAEA